MKRILLSVLVAWALLLSACGTPPAPVVEPEIPAHYTTYTDEAGLFSISYPPEWETALSLIEDIETSAKEVINSLESDIPVEKTSLIFFAGLQTATGYTPSVSIVVEPKPAGILTHDQMVEAEIRGVQKIASDFHQFSQVKTTVGGRKATIVDSEFTITGQSKGHFLLMIMLAGNNVWVVTCAPPSGEFSKWEEDFQAIIRSLRILK